MRAEYCILFGNLWAGSPVFVCVAHGKDLLLEDGAFLSAIFLLQKSFCS